MSGMKSKEDQKPAIQVLERMFSLLDLLASHQDPVSLKLISEQTGLHPSTAHRILNDLTVGRYVDRPEAGSYRLGMRLLELGNLVKARLDVRDAALGPMRELHKLTHQPVNLSMRQGDEIVYIERTYSERSGMQVVRAVGGRAPLHLTSVGKLFLAHDDVHLSPDAGVTEQLVDIQQSRHVAVDCVLGSTVTEHRPRNRYLGIVDGQGTVRVVNREYDLGATERGATGGTGEDDVLHLSAT